MRPAPFTTLTARPPRIDLELNRLNTRRRAGLLMMYAPAIGLALTMTAAVSFPNAGRLTTAVAGVGVMTILLGVVSAPLGAAMRILYATRLNTLSKRLDLDAQTDLPPLRKGTHLGSWRIARFSPTDITLVHEPGSRILSFVLRLAVEALLLTMLIAVVIGVARSANQHAAPWLSILFVFFAGTAILFRVPRRRTPHHRQPRDHPLHPLHRLSRLEPLPPRRLAHPLRRARRHRAARQSPHPPRRPPHTHAHRLRRRPLRPLATPPPLPRHPHRMPQACADPACHGHGFG